MNVEFSDRLSQIAWHHTMRYNDKYREQLGNWLMNFMTGGWVDQTLPPRAHDRSGKELDMPDWMKQPPGNFGTLRILAAPRDCQILPDNKMVCHEFSWAVFLCETDNYGKPGVETHCVINGGFINHSKSLENPDYATHT